ncbi:MAG: hypothetical protein A2042_03090 [Candidatus Schekmanbacteria bacterium GWA2_38_11]|uniref:Uncharacterized protein n=1 Tax=Candidatus Schekmanbacteria bacterium GWA2_38_11 TaxID=1817876 RepID=A0A1F7RBJ3_9BACT|nr:MAG: hypothetical protein A2042_03090 [Candidatus Schekmanbacteria bacterium GWA2_38_11]
MLILKIWKGCPKVTTPHLALPKTDCIIILFCSRDDPLDRIASVALLPRNDIAAPPGSERGGIILENQKTPAVPIFWNKTRAF